MKSIKTILVPSDFGEPSDAALAYAVDLAELTGAKVLLLHAFEVPIVGGPNAFVTTDITVRIVAGAQKALEEAVTTYRKRNVKIATFIKEGDSVEVILTEAAQQDADLIVIGTHGRRGIARALIGSVAESVVRKATVPVLTVHAAEAKQAA